MRGLSEFRAKSEQARMADENGCPQFTNTNHLFEWGTSEVDVASLGVCSAATRVIDTPRRIGLPGPAQGLPMGQWPSDTWCISAAQLLSRSPPPPAPAPRPPSLACPPAAIVQSGKCWLRRVSIRLAGLRRQTGSLRQMRVATERQLC